MVKLGLLYRQLSDVDFKVLHIIEMNILRYEYIPLEVIEKLTGIPDVKISLVVDKLHKLKLVRTKRVGERRFVKLTYIGLDMLALHDLVVRGVIKAVGDKVGVGKESDAYEILTIGGEKAIAKFLRIGRTSFRRTKVARDWASDPRYTWFIQSKIAAQREFLALKNVKSAGGHVPFPIDYSRHLVLIEYIDGVELTSRPQLEDPLLIFKQVIDTVKVAYNVVGIVHGDLSEYNIMVSADGCNAYIIDWPQYVSRDDPRAEELLRRDVAYVSSFFKKIYRIEINVDTMLSYVKGLVNEF